MAVKSSIYVTESDNELYFDGKLSKKELSENSILRIVRDIKYIGKDKTGVVTRRGSPPLEVIELDGEWNINKVIEEPETKKDIQSEKDFPEEKTAAEPKHKTIKEKSKKKLSGWDSLTQHERNLITCVKYDTCDDFDENERLAKIGFNKDGRDVSFSGIPRFEAGSIYILDDEEYKITKNNGKHLFFSFRGSPAKTILETDLTGEYIRPIKNNMKIIHSEDKWQSV
jgi:hypothetical protein